MFFQKTPPSETPPGGTSSKYESQLEAVNETVGILQRQVTGKDAMLASLRENEFAIRQELIGLNDGDLKRVAVLFDRSGSMMLKEIAGKASQAWPKDLTKWKLAQREIRMWLAHLPMEEVVLIDFNDTVSVFPEPRLYGRPMLKIRDANRDIVDENYKRLLRRFDSTENIQGGTNTRQALKAAQEYEDLSLIILFTDGKPHTAEGPPDELIRRIKRDLSSRSEQVPIYAVALGDYGEEQIAFLKDIAAISGGNFLGK